MADEEKKTASVNGAEVTEIVVPLRKAVIANGIDVNELRFREPTAADIERAGGNPVYLDGLGTDSYRPVFEPRFMNAMMSILAAVPPSTIKAMNTNDWNNAAWKIAGFFIPDR